MKKLISLFLGLCLMAGIMPVMAESAASHEITGNEFSFYFDSDDTGMKVKLWFVDGANDLPYMDAKDFFGLYGDFCGTQRKQVSFSMKAEGPVVTVTRSTTDPEAKDNGATMVIDFDADTIDFPDYNLFCYRKYAVSLVDMVTLDTMNDAGEPALVEKVNTGAFMRYGKELVLNLKDYSIDLIQQDGLYLIPLQTLSDFLMPNTDLGGFYFNGQCLILSMDVSQCGDLYYSAPAGERSKALTEYGYNELCLMLDNFYGLKDAHQIENFAQLFHDTGMEDALKDRNTKVADAAVYRLISDFISDGHTKWHAFSYLAGPDEITARDATREKIFEHRERQKEARAKAFPEGIPGYQEIGNTAYITFDNFYDTAGMSPDDYYDAEKRAALTDSDIFALIIKAHEQINRENSPIENVVLDLSANTGGKDNVAVFVISWFLGEAAVSTLDTMTGAMCTTVYRADLNLDRKFDEKDTVADKNLICLISPCSFSNGNFVPCMFKESGKVTLLGRTSAGGSCSVLNASTAWGTSFQISCPLRISFLKNGSFYDLDRGAEPDAVLASPAKYYDRQALTDYINSLY